MMRKRHHVLSGFGLNVRKARKSLGLTQERLSKKSGLNRRYISDVERGLRNVNILTVWRFAEALGTSMAALFDGIER